MAMHDELYEKEFARIYEEFEDELKNRLHDVPYFEDLTDEVDSAAAKIIRMKYGIPEGQLDEDWRELYHDDFADIIMPMLYGLFDKAALEYMGQGEDRADEASGVTTPPRRAVSVLQECGELMAKKGAAYNGFPQAEYYPYGLRDIWYMCFTKVKRLESQIVRDGEPNFEGIEDSARDLINYAAFLIEYAEGKMDGQK